MKRSFSTFVLLSCCAALAGCGSGPTHPSIATASLPELLPVRAFVANADAKWHYRVSPDGRTLAWNGVSRLRSAIQWQSLETPDAPVSSHRFRKDAPAFSWAADGQTLLYHEDASGRENHHVFALDTRVPDASPRDLTPYPGVKAFIVHVPRVASNRVFVMHNRRDRAVFDLFAVDLETDAITLLAENTDNVIQMMVDDSGAVRARVRQTDDARVLEVPVANEWRAIATASRFDVMSPVDLSADGGTLRLYSNVGRDKLALVDKHLGSGAEQVIFEHPQADLQGVLLSPLDQRPLAAYTNPGYPEVHYFDERLANTMESLATRTPAGVSIRSMSRDERLATASVYDDRGATFHLVNLADGTERLLGTTSSFNRREVLSTTRPFTFNARDGMQLHALITLPRTTSAAQASALPTVLLVHGGPWWRDHWEYQDRVQFLANRGYAVLQVNYRGSTGYGREYMHAAEGEFARAMHTDLLDGVQWAVDEGITDPDNVAIMGRSYGGYATLVGMTMTPGVFRCGIDIVGVSDWVSLIEGAPPYWQNGLHLWHRFLGDPADPSQRAEIDERSPLQHAAKAQGPLLVIHGRNDPRVPVDQSDRMVAALEAAGKEVRYVVIGGEGHSFDHWKNRMKIYRETEDFLAGCIGGRSSGFDFYQLGSWAF